MSALAVTHDDGVAREELPQLLGGRHAGRVVLHGEVVAAAQLGAHEEAVADVDGIAVVRDLRATVDHHLGVTAVATIGTILS